MRAVMQSSETEWKMYLGLQKPQLTFDAVGSLILNMFPLWNALYQTVAGIQLGLFTILQGSPDTL